MKPIKCADCNKFFDSDRYSGCPHCAGARTQFRPFDFSQTHENALPAEDAPIAEKAENEVIIPVAPQEEVQQLQNDAHAEEPAVNEEPVVNEEPEVEEDTPEEEFIPISEAVEKATIPEATEDMTTIAYYDLSEKVNPVAGWLVCLKGEYKGESFNIRTGRNRVGRALTNDIALAQERSVSREGHASITFDPKAKKYFIQSGEGRGLTYLNNELLMGHKELFLYDRISFGATEFMFISLCDEKFSWEDYEER